MGLEKINNMRKHIGMSIDELSEKSGVPKGTLSKITAGITKNPSIDTVKAIVHTMGFTLDDLDDFPRSKSGNDLSAENMELIKKYSNLDAHGKKIVDFVLNEESERSKANQKKEDSQETVVALEDEDSEYMELVARGGKYRVKKADVIKWAKQLDLDDYEEDHDLC